MYGGPSISTRAAAERDKARLYETFVQKIATHRPELLPLTTPAGAGAGAGAGALQPIPVALTAERLMV